MSDRADDLRLQIEAYNRLLRGAPASVAQYDLETIRKIEAELEKSTSWNGTRAEPLPRVKLAGGPAVS